MTDAPAVKLVEDLIDIGLDQPIRKANDRGSLRLDPNLSGCILASRKAMSLAIEFDD